MKKKVHLINIFIFICAMICLIYYDSHRSIWLKGITSAWFVLLGLINLIYSKNVKDKTYLILIEIGLFLGMCADVFLWVSLIMGILCFASGHIFYLIAFLKLDKFKLKDLIIILPIAIISLFIVFVSGLIVINDPIVYVLLIGYTFIISFMLGKSCSIYLERKTISTFIAFIGCTLFWFSDLMLGLDWFGNGYDIVGQLCVYSYWPAQNILAYSLYHYVNENAA